MQDGLILPTLAIEGSSMIELFALYQIFHTPSQSGFLILSRTEDRKPAVCRRHAATLFRITASDILRIRRFSGLSSGLFMFRFL